MSGPSSVARVEVDVEAANQAGDDAASTHAASSTHDISSTHAASSTHDAASTRDAASPASTALFVSPHLDDVAFSCGATAALLAAAGMRCILATVFTRSVPAPTGFALACQLDKGLGPDIDYMQLRRDEDAAFTGIARLEARWLDFAEAPHRGYRSPGELFGPPRPDDDIVDRLVVRLQALVDELRPEIVVAPLALGSHVDHLQVRHAIERLTRRPATAWYRDMPYAMRVPTAGGAGSHDPAGPRWQGIAVGQTLAAKLAGCAAYRSQLDFQFAGVERMREALTAFAADEGRRSGIDGPAERFLVTAEVAAALDAAVGTTYS